MSRIESWWHLDLCSTISPVAADHSILTVAGASGHLVEAPPVYAPGGLVLLVLAVDDEAALVAIEPAAAAAGAVISVVPRFPGQSEDLITDAGYKRTTENLHDTDKRPSRGDHWDPLRRCADPARPSSCADSGQARQPCRGAPDQLRRAGSEPCGDELAGKTTSRRHEGRRDDMYDRNLQEV